MTTIAGDILQTVWAHLSDPNGQRFSAADVLRWVDDALQVYSNALPLPQLAYLSPDQNRAGDYWPLPANFRTMTNVYMGCVPFHMGHCFPPMHRAKHTDPHWKHGNHYDIVYHNGSAEHRAYMLTSKCAKLQGQATIHYLGNHHRINDVSDDIDIPTNHEPVIWAYVQAIAALREEFKCADCEGTECDCGNTTTQATNVIKVGGASLNQISVAARNQLNHWNDLFNHAQTEGRPAYSFQSKPITPSPSTHYDNDSQWN